MNFPATTFQPDTFEDPKVMNTGPLWLCPASGDVEYAGNMTTINLIRSFMQCWNHTMPPGNLFDSVALWKFDEEEYSNEYLAKMMAAFLHELRSRQMGATLASKYVEILDKLTVAGLL